MSEKTKKTKTPNIVIDKTLEKFYEKVLFPEKLKLANKIIAEVGLPSAIKN